MLVFAASTVAGFQFATSSRFKPGVAVLDVPVGGLTLDEAADLRKSDPKSYVERAYKTMARHVDAMAACQDKGAEVFNWEVEGRPDDVFYRIVPGGNFPNPDGSDSEVGNLHLGIFSTTHAPPYPAEMQDARARVLAACKANDVKFLNAVRPDDAPTWQLRLQFTFLFPE